MIQKELQAIIERYCWGCEPTQSQATEITDLANSLGADLNEVFAYMEEMMAKPSREQMEAMRRQEIEEQAKRERMRRESEARAKKLMEEVAEKERLAQKLQLESEKNRKLLEDEKIKAEQLRDARNRDKEDKIKNERKVNRIANVLFWTLVGMSLLLGIYAGLQTKEESFMLAFATMLLVDMFVTIPLVWVVEKILRLIYKLEIKFGYQFM